jgi:hypothetical protein
VRSAFAKASAVALCALADTAAAGPRIKHAILRNEPTVLAAEILCIMRMVS